MPKRGYFNVGFVMTEGIKAKENESINALLAPQYPVESVPVR
jgi:hypothetical protein